jgi:hypothetical protein
MKSSRIILFLLTTLVSGLLLTGFVNTVTAFLGVGEVSPVWILSCTAGIGLLRLQLYHERPTGLMLNFGFTDLSFPDQQENPAGLQVLGYWIPITDLDDPLPSMVALAQATNNTLATTLQGNFNPKTNKHFIVLYNTMDTGGVKEEAVGELDGKSWEYMYEGFFPGYNEDARAFARKITNTRGIFIRLTVDGKRIVVGSREFPAVLEAGSIDTGKATADRRGFTFTIKGRGTGPAPMYKGPIKLASSTIASQS